MQAVRGGIGKLRLFLRAVQGGVVGKGLISGVLFRRSLKIQQETFCHNESSIYKFPLYFTKNCQCDTSTVSLIQVLFVSSINKDMRKLI